MLRSRFLVAFPEARKMAVFEGSPKSLFSEQADRFGCLSHKVYSMLRIIYASNAQDYDAEHTKAHFPGAFPGLAGTRQNEVLRKCAL